jgi:hypothetical protein
MVSGFSMPIFTDQTVGRDAWLPSIVGYRMIVLNGKDIGCVPLWRIGSVRAWLDSLSGGAR